MIHSLQIRGYRSLADFSHDLGATARRLALQDGATRFLEDLGPKRVWSFND